MLLERVIKTKKMKKIIVITSIALLSLGFNSCTDQDSIIDVKNNACKLQHLRKVLDQNPTDKVMQDSVELYEMFVKINRENYVAYGLGSNDEFNKEVAEYLETCE